MNMKHLIVRQPIFNIDLSIFGYEILYKNPSVNSEESAANLINKVFLEMDFRSLSGNKPLIIKFSNELIKKKIPLSVSLSLPSTSQLYIMFLYFTILKLG